MRLENRQPPRVVRTCDERYYAPGIKPHLRYPVYPEPSVYSRVLMSHGNLHCVLHRGHFVANWKPSKIPERRGYEAVSGEGDSLDEAVEDAYRKVIGQCERVVQ